MEREPLVTAVVTTYDRPELCKRAIRSVQAQTYEPLETIVVEDGTETGLREWLAAEFPSVRYVRHEENRGLAAARNTGLERASGEFIAYLDDDDEWKPARIQRQIEKFHSVSSAQQEQVGVVYCGVECCTPDGETKHVSHPQNRGDLWKSIRENGASTRPSTFLFTREALLDVGGFDEELVSSIDHDIWMSMASSGFHAIAIEEPLVIIYDSNHRTMTTNTYPRITGVKQFVRKWTPVFQEMYGVEMGNRFGEQYFVRVIATLVGKKIASRDFGEAWDATREIFEFSDQHGYNARILTYSAARSVVLQRFPKPAVTALRRVKRATLD